MAQECALECAYTIKKRQNVTSIFKIKIRIAVKEEIIVSKGDKA